MSVCVCWGRNRYTDKARFSKCLELWKLGDRNMEGSLFSQLLCLLETFHNRNLPETWKHKNFLKITR